MLLYASESSHRKVVEDGEDKLATHITWWWIPYHQPIFAFKLYYTRTRTFSLPWPAIIELRCSKQIQSIHMAVAAIAIAVCQSGNSIRIDQIILSTWRHMRRAIPSIYRIGRAQTWWNMFALPQSASITDGRCGEKEMKRNWAERWDERSHLQIVVVGAKRVKRVVF